MFHVSYILWTRFQGSVTGTEHVGHYIDTPFMGDTYSSMLEVLGEIQLTWCHSEVYKSGTLTKALTSCSRVIHIGIYAYYALDATGHIVLHFTETRPVLKFLDYVCARKNS